MPRIDQEQWKSADVARLLALVESERRYYEDLFAALPLPVAIVDADWRLVAVNRDFRRSFGPFEDLAALRLPDLLPDPALETLLGQVLASGQTVSNVLIRLGPARALRVSLTRIPGWQAHGEDELMVTFAEAEAAVDAAGPDRQTIEEAKRGAVERLSGRVSHVANNLLMIIGGYGAELLESIPAGDPRRDDVEQILAASSRLASLTRELTTLVRPPAFTAADFDLAAWAQPVAERLGLSPGPIPPGLFIRTAPALLEQMLAEAARYLRGCLGQAGSLVLDAIDEPDAVEIRLRVEGAELSAAAAERIFEPFSGEKVGTDPPLGLAGLVRPWLALDGQLSFDDACLRLACPRGVVAARRVLLVEDEPGIRALIVKALQRENFQVVECASAEHALTQAGTAPDVLVTDIRLPGLSGRELDSRLRLRWPALRTLYISGYTADARLDAQIGADALPPGTAFLAKPFSAAQLVEALCTLLTTTTFQAGA
jgi:CheY-like chemotaxis protein